MIGLEYMMELNNMNGVKLAKELGTTKQNISYWITNKRISKKYLPILSKLFNVGNQYLSKEINEIDAINIRILKNNNIEYTKSELDKFTVIELLRSTINNKNIELYKKFLLLTNSIDNETLENILDNLIKLSKC